MTSNKLKSAEVQLETRQKGDNNNNNENFPIRGKQTPMNRNRDENSGRKTMKTLKSAIKIAFRNRKEERWWKINGTRKD